MRNMESLDVVRRHFAEEVCLAGGIQSGDVAAAFATVPREAFLGPGPWLTPLAPRQLGEEWSYRPTPDADPRHLYHNVLVAIDPDRALHSGLPSFLAFKIEAARIREKDRVVHVGCGVGYYTAVMAELASGGHVVAIEADEELAERSRENLKPWANVEVVAGDGTKLDPGEADVFFINAGVTHPSPIWLERLAPSGRLVLPLTRTKDGGPSQGIVLLIEPSEGQFAARAISWISVYDCVGGRDDRWNVALDEALARGDADRIHRLAKANHAPAEGCWVHVADYCFSMKDVN